MRSRTSSHGSSPRGRQKFALYGQGLIVNQRNNSVSVASDVISLRRFSGAASAATAWAVIFAWVVYLGICASQCFDLYGQDGHAHSVASQAVSHHDYPEEAPDDSGCCSVLQDISVRLHKNWSGTPVHFIPALIPIPFVALAVVTSPPKWAEPPTTAGLPRTYLITPLWPNAPPAAYGFLS